MKPKIVNTEEQVVGLEDDVICLKRDLQVIESFDEGIPRDYLGTLHINLASLAIQVERVLKMLEANRGFRRSL